MSSACRAVAFECNGTPAAASILVTYKDYIAGHVAAFSKNLSLRSDLDMFLKKSSDEARSWKELMYLGVGVQYNFK